MRPVQNRRMRNRTRKPPNPLTKSFESNGPDVKVRGTAQHIAEKYTQLSRDAHASGDPVAAENYLQHAEHYVRIILAAQAQFPQSGGFPRPFDDDQDDGEDGGLDYGVQNYGAPQPEQRFSASEDNGQPAMQPRERPAPRTHERFERPERQDRPERQERFERPERQERFERPDRPERFERPEQQPQRQDRPERPERFERPEQQARPQRQDRPERQDRRERFRRHRDEIGGFGQQAVSDDAGANLQPALPAFLTTPVRMPSNNDEQPALPLTHDLDPGKVEPAPRAERVASSAIGTDDADKPAPRVRRRRIVTDDVTTKPPAEATTVRKPRVTRVRRKSVDDDAPVGE